MKNDRNIPMPMFYDTLIVPVELEETLNQIAGVVTNGLFARRSDNTLLLGTDNGVRTITI